MVLSDAKVTGMQFPPCVNLKPLHVWMGNFDHPTLKPTILRSSSYQLTIGLKQKMTRAVRLLKGGNKCVKVHIVDGELKITGTGALKATQEYTQTYARKTVEGFQRWR